MARHVGEEPAHIHVDTGDGECKFWLDPIVLARSINVAPVEVRVPQLAEIGRALAYPKLRHILGWDNRRIENFIRQLYVRAQIVDLAGTSVEVPGDPDDIPILATLIAAKADVLVTGDGDLLALRDRHSIQTPAEFMRRL